MCVSQCEGDRDEGKRKANGLGRIDGMIAWLSFPCFCSFCRKGRMGERLKKVDNNNSCLSNNDLYCSLQVQLSIFCLINC